jgi:hypothetical protein
MFLNIPHGDAITVHSTQQQATFIYDVNQVAVIHLLKYFYPQVLERKYSGDAMHYGFVCENLGQSVLGDLFQAGRADGTVGRNITLTLAQGIIHLGAFPVPGGYKCGDLALQVGGVSNLRQ